ncbi:phage tail assembly protein [Providencia rettgeri]|uniref:phage tail assembly protein n=1 Tax=Providencia rettgeri TaxID=587 RepID=UPI001B39C3B4|nr:phage tail assembly protein [Providencia rettgeri]MBQ0210917.1 phage tail assembly protein [Providencia rettgeri]MDR9616520.1 phage tail assembly protein [Providencia rettgeri]
MSIVKFNTPVKIQGGREITEVTITDTMRQAGALRGLKLWEVATGDVNSLITLLPRVTQPRLTEQDIASMPIDCFAQLANEVATFLAPSAPAEEMDAQEN